MAIPMQITVRDVDNSAPIEAKIRERAEKLTLFHPRIESCKIVVDVPQKHKHNGKLYNVHIEVLVPGKILVANRNPNQDLYVAIRDAFNAVQRQVEDHARKQRGEIKNHREMLKGRIARLFTDERYGFIETAEGQEYYFHGSNMIYPDFDKLEVGIIVQFTETVGGDSLQASHISVMNE